MRSKILIGLVAVLAVSLLGQASAADSAAPAGKILRQGVSKNFQKRRKVKKKKNQI